MDTVVAELASFFQALKSGNLFAYLILLVLILIWLALTIVAIAYQRIAIKRFQTASKATQENFETVAADLRKRALEVKKQDEGLRKRELEVKERKQQEQVLKRSRRALNGSVSHTMLQTDFKGMTSVIPDRSRVQRRPGIAEAPIGAQSVAP
jgi:predicted membrane protein